MRCGASSNSPLHSIGDHYHHRYVTDYGTRTVLVPSPCTIQTAGANPPPPLSSRASDGSIDSLRRNTRVNSTDRDAISGDEISQIWHGENIPEFQRRSTIVLVTDIDSTEVWPKI